MATLVHPDGTAKVFTYAGIESAHQQLGGYFDSVPVDHRAGHLVFVHEYGCLDNLPRNPLAERLTRYPEIHGPAAFISYVEADEDHLIGEIDPEIMAHLSAELAKAVPNG